MARHHLLVAHLLGSHLQQMCGTKAFVNCTNAIVAKCKVANADSGKVTAVKAFWKAKCLMKSVMEELMKFTLLTRDRSDYLVDRYSERVESAEELMKRVNASVDK